MEKYAFITFLAEFAFIAAHALALAAHAVTVSIAIGHFALIVAQGALFTLPTGITNTFTVNVLAMLGAQHWANALAAVVATKAGIALTMAQQALSIAGATVRAILCHILGNGGVEGDLLRVTIVIVQRDEPVTGLHVTCNFACYR